MPFLFSQFCFPDLEDERGSPNDRLSESFTFTLTQDEGTRIFGFCRRLVQSGQLPICLCVLSRRPWFSLFMHMLDILQLNYDLGRFIPAFVAAARDVLVPPPGDATPMKIEPIYKGSAFFGTFSLKPPVEDRPTGVHFEGILSSLGVSNTLRVLGALMTEQHVVFVGARWGHVSGCVHAATSMLYPLQWQHILIPVLPKSKLSYACAPMPYVLGVCQRHLAALQKEPLDMVLFVDVDKGEIWGEEEALDLAMIPTPHKELLERDINKVLPKTGKGGVYTGGRVDDNAVADAILAFMVRLLGAYRRFVKPGAGGNDGIHKDFDETAFLNDAPESVRPFLRTLRASQLFEVWLGHHVEMEDSARGLSAFEQKVAETPSDQLGGNATWVNEPLPVEEKEKKSAASRAASAAEKLKKGVSAAPDKVANLKEMLKNSDAPDKLQSAAKVGAATAGKMGVAALKGAWRGAKSVRETVKEKASDVTGRLQGQSKVDPLSFSTSSRERNTSASERGVMVNPLAGSGDCGGAATTSSPAQPPPRKPPPPPPPRPPPRPVDGTYKPPASARAAEAPVRQPSISLISMDEDSQMMPPQQPQGGDASEAAEMEAAIRMSEEEASKRAASQDTAREQEELQLALALSASEAEGQQQQQQPAVNNNGAVDLLSPSAEIVPPIVERRGTDARLEDALGALDILASPQPQTTTAADDLEALFGSATTPATTTPAAPAADDLAVLLS